MQVKEITVSRAVKINVKNYENTDIGVTITASVDKDEDASAVYQTLAQNTRDLIRAEVDAIELGQRQANSKASRFGV